MKIVITVVIALTSGFAYFFIQGRIPSPPPTSVTLRHPLADCNKETGIAKIVCLAENFKATLSDAQLSSLQLTYSVTDAKRWSNFPQAFSRPSRIGLAFGSLHPTQLASAKALMAAVLSQDTINEGYDELEGGLIADDIIAKATGKTSTFGAGNFYIAFLGQPSASALWELQYGGHHFAFANTYKGGQLMGATPSFRGTEPMETQANGRTYQPLEQEKAAFSKIIALLNEKEVNTARMPNSFSNLLLGPGKDGQFPTNKQGIRVGDLTQTQQEQVKKGIKLYVYDLETATADAVMAIYNAELADTYLSFSGSGSMSQVGDYMRIDGPSIWLEYSTQGSRDFPNSTHAHSVWRDRKSDYGGN